MDLSGVAELVAANKGLGYFILSSIAWPVHRQDLPRHHDDRLLGLITTKLFKVLRARLLPWQPIPRACSAHSRAGGCEFFRFPGAAIKLPPHPERLTEKS